MKTQYYTATSVDGYLADENGSLDWLLQFGEVEGANDDYARFVDRVGAAAMGSTTYERMVDHEYLLENPGAWPYEMPVGVFASRDLPAVDGADVRSVEGDVAPVHAELVDAADGENVWLGGGGDLVGQFHDRGFLDGTVLSVAPVTLASGAPLPPRRIADPPPKLVGVERRGDVFAVPTDEVRRLARRPTAGLIPLTSVPPGSCRPPNPDGSWSSRARTRVSATTSSPSSPATAAGSPGWTSRASGSVCSGIRTPSGSGSSSAT